MGVADSLQCLIWLYRCSLMGFDLNRHWQEPSLYAHPTLYATKQLVMQYDRNQVSGSLCLSSSSHTCIFILNFLLIILSGSINP